MAYPEDYFSAFDRFWAPVWMDRVTNLPDDAEITLTRNEVLAMLQAPSVTEIMQQTSSRAFSGQIAGHLLMLCIAMDTEGLPVSIRQAKFLVRKYYQRVRQTHGQVIKSSISSIEAAWQEYRHVAHLWAAFSAIRMKPAGASKALTPDVLEKFVAWSVWFRLKGEKLVPARQRPARALLDLENAWDFPIELVVPLPARIKLRLPDWAKTAIAEYKRH